MTRVQHSQAWWMGLMVGLVGLAVAYVPHAAARGTSLAGRHDPYAVEPQALTAPLPQTITESQVGLMGVQHNDGRGGLAATARSRVTVGHNLSSLTFASGHARRVIVELKPVNRPPLRGTRR
jgi:hypothetical protein